MKAGATSMWASCCGLLNEVMGTGAHVCCDCKKDFCSVCSVIQENFRRCCTCHLLQETAFQRPQLMRLKVRDLRQYLILRNIPIDTCREKADLVDLVLCHHGSEADMDTHSLNSSRSQTSSGFFTHPFFSTCPVPSPTVSSSQGDFANQRGSSGPGALSQGQGETASTHTEDDDENAEETPGLSRKRMRASLSDLSSLEDVEGMSVRQLKEILARNFVNYSGCCEKWELIERVNRLYKENEENQKSYGDKTQLNDEEDDNLCRICMDAVIDCVLLECGHMVTCTKCGKRMSECPICRQYVVRAVHVFKS
ncbi:E3 ubiquitin-protein ligase RNF34 isoform X4 [Monodelphis domestica]|uniref:E3 ubiquitin-protein ligase RNF34 isoform X4 n=1 Tax=Monodelphis domestica TaxID=13616 RepID=UPI0024E1C5AA|nr:E3 ubiquitin-protein ligase RNF34 isoform X4 [Monodelphis domestica]